MLHAYVCTYICAHTYIYICVIYLSICTNTLCTILLKHIILFIMTLIELHQEDCEVSSLTEIERGSFDNAIVITVLIVKKLKKVR